MKSSVLAIAALLTFVCEANASEQPGDSAQAMDKAGVPQRVQRLRCSDDKQHDYIVNGLYTIGYPSVGALLVEERPGKLEFYCSGTLIGRSTFVTAAHCFSWGDDDRKFTVFFPHAGFYDMAGKPFIGPDSTVSTLDDIAVIKLSRAVDGIKPSLLSSQIVQPETEATIVGFGRTKKELKDSGLKRYGFITTKSCGSSERVSERVNVCWEFKKPLIAPGTNSSTCEGDSGGPLFITVGDHFELAGVHAGPRDPIEGADNCAPGEERDSGKVLVDTRISKYLDWLKERDPNDVGSQSCGQGPCVGSPEAPFCAVNENMPATLQDDGIDRYSIVVENGVKEIRFGLNGTGEKVKEFALTARSADGSQSCTFSNRGLFSFCSFKEKPKAGTWNITVKIVKKEIPDNINGIHVPPEVSGQYQLVATMLK